jgi:alcohol dehydrogenase
MGEGASPALPTAVDWDTRLGDQRVVFGAGALANLGALAAEAGCSRVLVVSDPGLVGAGHPQRAAAILAASGVRCEIFSALGENPSEAEVAACAAALLALGADGVVAVGGGSAMDCAKAGNLVACCGGRAEDYWGYGKATRDLLPAIGVPTTAGTGSEAQAYALVSREGDHRKLAIGDERMRFATVVLDPTLVVSVPRRVAALAGIDAISHAVESYVSRPANPISRLFAAEAWRLLDFSLPAVLATAQTEAAEAASWAPVLLGAHLAGRAIDTAMLGAAHALANPLTARHGVAHGAAVALVLPAVVRYNAVVAEAAYRALVAAGSDGGGGAEALARRLEELRALCGLPARLREVGVSAEDLDPLAVAAASQWTAGFNPRAVDQAALRAIYTECW